MTRLIKRPRRTREELRELRGSIRDVLSEIQPASVRQTFYQLVIRGVIDKTENAYKHLDALLTSMRRDREIPFDWLVDNTRWMRKPASYSSLADMLERQQEFYRRALWDKQAAYVEIWLEKDALSGVLSPVTSLYDVPLMVTRGYPSISYLHSAAMTIKEKEKPTYIYYFGDHDPSGVDITRVVEKGLREFAPDADIYFERIAVTEEQIEELNLPTRPTKVSDGRTKNFIGDSVEVDAIAPATLRELVEDCITQHIDEDELKRLEVNEGQDRDTLRNIIQNLPGCRNISWLKVREHPTIADRRRARDSELSPQQMADNRVLAREAPDLFDKGLTYDEAMSILEERKRQA